MVLDYKTIAFIKHSLAGKLKSSRTCVSLLQSGKTHLSNDEDILTNLNETLSEITDFLVKLEEENGTH